MTTPDPRPRLSPGFIWIIAFKWVKAAAFLLIGAAALHIARLPRHSEALEIAHFLGAHTRELVVQHVSQVLDALSSGQIQAIGAASILVGLVFGAEGTALGIPPELIEIARGPESYRRYLLLAVNVAILVYLWRRRNEFRTPAAER